ncbi:hypothetical protein O9G_005281 [Rozella allomycis CSF55]|uniref:Uncharacterized protein n=1 Tax=Rozella allomycis (strain CSF55) TaxID=988480 RepID=A0A075B3A2_ROZAC|nr:hypothetical protein O9G_005281 [Rozella allomycis CSF55]|eukprot:EPZ35446.1 hypothetical protein O9G_005281 [Rozella allomycis CSF55]
MHITHEKRHDFAPDGAAAGDVFNVFFPLSSCTRYIGREDVHQILTVCKHYKAYIVHAEIGADPETGLEGTILKAHVSKQASTLDSGLIDEYCDTVVGLGYFSQERVDEICRIKV